MLGHRPTEALGSPRRKLLCQFCFHFDSIEDRIEIADGLAREEPAKSIAKRIGKSFQSVYKEIARNRKPDGRYQPWYAHNQAHQRRRRPKVRVFARDEMLRRARRRQARHAVLTRTDRGAHQDRSAGGCGAATAAAQRDTCAWRRSTKPCTVDWSWPRRVSPCAPGGPIVGACGHGRSRDGSLKQSTNLTPIAQRPFVSYALLTLNGHRAGTRASECR
nr:helix-turn-helix domain-containing protein [Rhodococcus qingshengii]